MRRHIRPLRYPGGKARMASWLIDAFDAASTPMDVDVWIEPFAGGAGAGLTALESGAIGELWLIESNPCLAAFWSAVVDDTDALAARVETAQPDLDLFHTAQELVAAVLAGESADSLEVAFATFVVNRCSRSGMVRPKVGPIGGKQQSGRWTISARYNAGALGERIRAIGALRSSITVIGADGIDYLAGLTDSGINDEVFCFVDPPYIAEGNRLYANGMSSEDHERLAHALCLGTTPWVLTYDAHHRVLDLYGDRPIVEFDIPHTANRHGLATEYIICSHPHLSPRTNPLGKGGLRYLTGLPPAQVDRATEARARKVQRIGAQRQVSRCRHCTARLSTGGDHSCPHRH